MATKFDAGKYSFKSAFDSAPEFAKFGANALLMFAMSQYLEAEDVDEFATEGLVDGGDDKKVDFCLVDTAGSRAVIAQSYVAREWGKLSAPSNKASDLNTATAWLFSANERRIPEVIKPRETLI